MSQTSRQIHLGVFVLGTGNLRRLALPGCRHQQQRSGGDPGDRPDRRAGEFDLLFVADGLVMDPGDHPSFLCRFEPTTLIAVLSATTRHVGLGATVSTSFGEPYHVARTFASIDHISQGRAAWNVVTGSSPQAR